MYYVVNRVLFVLQTWNPKSKTEPYAQSAVELMTHAKETVNGFFEIPLGMSEDLVHDLSDGLEHLFRDYTTFVASCGKNHLKIFLVCNLCYYFGFASEIVEVKHRSRG